MSEKRKEADTNEEPVAKKSKLDKPVKIQSLDLKDDAVTIINRGNDSVNLEGWTLKSNTGNQSFVFPNLELQPGATVTIWSGKGASAKHNPPSVIGWTNKYIWNDKGDSASLLNKQGDVVDEVSHEPLEKKDVTIQTLDLVADYVTIMNRGSSDVDLSGWILRSVTGSQYFKFPSGSVLAKGACASIWSGKESDKKHHPPGSYHWTKRFIWNNNGDSAALYNSHGELVDTNIEFSDKLERKVDLSKFS